MTARPAVLVVGPVSSAGLSILRSRLGPAADVVADAGAPLARAAIVSGPPLTPVFFDRVPGLRFLYRMGSAGDGRGEEAAEAARRGVATARTPPGLSAAATAEHALALILALMKRVVESDAYVRSGAWTRPNRFEDTCVELAGSLVGIVGLGGVGARLAALVHALGAEVVYTRRSGPAPGAPGRFVSLDELLSAADVVSLHVRSQPGGFLLGEGDLSLMKPGSFFVNTARGELVDEAALARHLDGNLAGAALDVVRGEPSVDARLLGHPRVILTPHIAGRTACAAVRYYGAAAEAVQRHLADGP